MKSIAEIKIEIERLAAMIGALDSHALPMYERTEDFARPHIEVNSSGYHFVVIERGQELERFTTFALEDLLCKIFHGVTFSLASDYELAHRIESQDCRRTIFRRQVELLALISKRWADCAIVEHEQILREHLFDDHSAMRASLSARVGWKKACEQYPISLK